MLLKDWRLLYYQKYAHSFKQKVIWEQFSSYLQTCSPDHHPFWDVQAPTIPGFINVCDETQDIWRTMQMYSEAKNITATKVGLSNAEYQKNWVKQQKKEQDFYSKMIDDYIYTCAVCPEMIGVKPLAPLCTESCPSIVYRDPWGVTKQEGINPMLNTKTTATNLEFNLSAEMPKSEAATQREYLLGRLEGLKSRYDEVPRKLRADLHKAFNLDAKDLPTDPEEFMKLLKKGDISLDQKRIDKLKARAETYEDDCDFDDMLDDEGKPNIYRYHSLTSFLVWKDAPKADLKGLAAAIDAWQKDFQTTRDTIMVSSAADGLEALQKMEAWTLKGSKSVH